jgi:hypothetical protein
MPLLGPDGVTPAVQAREPEPPSFVEATTAFLAIQLPSGRWVVTDVLDTVIVAERKPTQDDLIAGAANVHAEITARKAADMAAATTIQTQMAMARQVQGQQMTPEEEAAAAAIRSRQVPPAFRGGRQ